MCVISLTCCMTMSNKGELKMQTYKPLKELKQFCLLHVFILEWPPWVLFINVSLYQGLPRLLTLTWFFSIFLTTFKYYCLKVSNTLCFLFLCLLFSYFNERKRSFLRTRTMSVMFCIMPRSMLATHPKYVFKAFCFLP